MAALAGMGIGGGSQTSFDATDVNDQLGKTLNKGGLLMRMAQSKGQQVASSRGLSNSTIGIDAAQRAVVDAALPIAQQNAQQNWTTGENSKDRSHQLTMQSNSFGHDKDMADINFTNQTKLNQQQAQLQEKRDQLLWQQQLGTLDKQGQLELQQLDKQLSNQQTLNTQQFGQQKELNTQQAYLQAERDTLQNKFQQGILDKEGQQRIAELDKQLSSQKALNEQQNTYNSAEAQKDRAQQLTLLEKNASKDMAYMAQQVAANTHGMYLSAIDSQVTSYNERVAALEVAQDIKTTDKPAMKASMEKELAATLQMYGTLYSNINTIRPDWTQFPTKVLPTVGIEDQAAATEQTKPKSLKESINSFVDSFGEQAAGMFSNVNFTPKTPTAGELAARGQQSTGVKLLPNVAAPIKQGVVTSSKTPSAAELAARGQWQVLPNVAAPIRPIK